MRIPSCTNVYNTTTNLAINFALAIVLPGMTFISFDLYPTKVTHGLTYTWQHLGASRLQLLQRYLVVSGVVEEIPSAVELQLHCLTITTMATPAPGRGRLYDREQTLDIILQCDAESYDEDW